jgi:hypothetical protein
LLLLTQQIDENQTLLRTSWKDACRHASGGVSSEMMVILGCEHPVHYCRQTLMWRRRRTNKRGRRGWTVGWQLLLMLWVWRERRRLTPVSW